MNVTTEGVIAILYVILAWYFLAYFQNHLKIGFIGSLSDYFVYKVIICFVLGWVIIPIGLIVMILAKMFGKKNKTA